MKTASILATALFVLALAGAPASAQSGGYIHGHRGSVGFGISFGDPYYYDHYHYAPRYYYRPYRHYYYRPYWRRHYHHHHHW